MRSLVSFFIAKEGLFRRIIFPVVTLAIVIFTVFMFGFLGDLTISEKEYQDIADLAQPAALRAADGGVRTNSEDGKPISQSLRENIEKAARDGYDFPTGPIATELVAEAPPGWREAYLCPVRGWGQLESTVRRLVARGFGKCDWTQRFVARSPVLTAYGGLVGGLILFGLVLLSLVTFGLSFVTIFLRGPYKWLYESSTFRG